MKYYNKFLKTHFWLSGQLKTKPSVYSRMNLLHQKQVILIRNLGKMRDLTVEIPHCRAAVTEPSQILKLTEKYPKSEGALNNRRYFLLMLPKEITSEAFCQALIAAVAHCLRREPSGPQDDCAEDIDTARAPMPAQEGTLVWVRYAVTAALPLPRVATSKARDNPWSQQAFSQHRVTSHKPWNATGRDDKKLLFYLDSRLFYFKKQHSSPSPPGPQRTAVQSSRTEPVFFSTYYNYYQKKKKKRLYGLVRK